MVTEPTFRPLNPDAADLVPDGLFEASELARFARPAHKSGAEPTALLERLTTHRGTLVPGHTYLDTIGTCRICERPGGGFRAPLCAQTLTYCHRCLAVAVDGLPNMAATLTRATARATVAVRALADDEFGGAAFVESQLSTIHADPQLPVLPADIDRRLLLRIAITRGQLPWTHILIDAGLADNGVRLSRGTVLKAADGHLCLSLQEKSGRRLLRPLRHRSHARTPVPVRQTVEP